MKHAAANKHNKVSSVEDGWLPPQKIDFSFLR
jgi:hypothetical protein